MQMTDEQIWTDLARFAEAMKRAARVVFDDGDCRPDSTSDIHSGRYTSFENIAKHGGVREIIEPPQKKVRPLNAEEWKGVAGCLLITPQYIDGGRYVFESFDEVRAAKLADFMATCHPPGFPNDIRKLWVEE